MALIVAGRLPLVEELVDGTISIEARHLGGGPVVMVAPSVLEQVEENAPDLVHRTDVVYQHRQDVNGLCGLRFQLVQ